MMTNCIVTRHEWKDLKGWQDFGLPLSTSSNEAAKMLDALLTQLMGWYDDESLGGVYGTVTRIKEADPEYVLGPLLESCFKLSIHKPETFPQLQASLDNMESLVQKKSVMINEWEMKHVKAVRFYAQGYPSKSLNIWEDMIKDNPCDALSLRMAYMTALKLGDMPKMNTMLPNVIQSWRPDTPFFGYIHGMYAFALNEANHPEEAEEYALKALEINPYDSWSTHARVHVLDGTNRAQEGIAFLEKNEEKWQTGTFLLEHNCWHWALFYVDKGDFESALSILDGRILPKCYSGSLGALRDAASLLYRLQLEGISTGGRWHDVNSIWGPSEQASVFHDVHMLMNNLGARDYDSANSLLETCNEFLRVGKGTNWEVTKEVGKSLYEALLAFDKAPVTLDWITWYWGNFCTGFFTLRRSNPIRQAEQKIISSGGHTKSDPEQYDDVVEILLPVRDNVIKIGGSGSQRDVFNLLLTHAAIRSATDRNKKLATELVEERKESLGKTGVTVRLEKRLLKQHGKS